MPKTFIITQVRVGSSRFPGKVLKELHAGKTMLFYYLERLRRSRLAAGVVAAIPDNAENDALLPVCEASGVTIFRGSEQDVLARYYGAAKSVACDGILRNTSDCPISDPDAIDLVIEKAHANIGKVDYVSNFMRKTYPHGYESEWMSFPALEKSFLNAKAPEEREHADEYILRRKNEFRLMGVENPKPPDPEILKARLTVDYEEDFLLIREIFAELYPKNSNFSLSDVARLLSRKPELMKINSNRAKGG